MGHKEGEGAHSLSQHGSHCLAVLRIQRSVDFVEQVEGGRVHALDGKDEGQRDERLLATAQLLHRHWLVRPKSHLYLQEQTILSDMTPR
jgi:hypothetical protein